ncbi:MAG: putative transporter, partial [Ramlibacter sp.]|nr:putative transporter [Ramlibacter sp.]
SLLVVLGVRNWMGEKEFGDWGWRIPFLVSIILRGVSVWIRLSLAESPAFQKMKSEGKISKAPLKESFGEWRNLKIVILALLGLTAGQAVVWYCGQFYALFFMTTIAKVDGTTANLFIAAALLIGTPFFVVFGSLSDRIGRKPIIMAGCLIAALTYFSVFPMLLKYANPALLAAQEATRVTVTADPKTCSFQGSPIARDIDFTTSCDIAKRALTQSYIPYENKVGPAGTPATVSLGDKVLTAPVGTLNEQRHGFSAESTKAIGDFRKTLGDNAKAAGLTSPADPAKMNKVMVLLLLVFLVILVTMVYGPIAAMLVELFPTRIRYTSMSLPYHVGNGWFGGLLPTTAFAMVAATGDIYYGLWYPVVVAAATFVIGTLFIRETKDVDIYARD